MPAPSPIPIGPDPAMALDMGSVMATAIGGLHSGTMAAHTARWVLVGTVDMADSVRFARHPARRDLVRHRRPTPLRSSGRSCEALIFVSCRA